MKNYLDISNKFFFKLLTGEVAEWLKAHAWKACIEETLSWVRIPFSPPLIKLFAKVLSLKCFICNLLKLLLINLRLKKFKKTIKSISD